MIVNNCWNHFFLKIAKTEKKMSKIIIIQMCNHCFREKNAFKTYVYSSSIFQFQYKIFSLSLFALNLWLGKRTWKIVSQYPRRFFLLLFFCFLSRLQNKKLTLLGSCLKTDWILREAYIKRKQALAQWLIKPLLPSKKMLRWGKSHHQNCSPWEGKTSPIYLRLFFFQSFQPLDSRIHTCMTADISNFSVAHFIHFTSLFIIICESFLFSVGYIYMYV